MIIEKLDVPEIFLDSVRGFDTTLAVLSSDLLLVFVDVSEPAFGFVSARLRDSSSDLMANAAAARAVGYSS